MPRIKVGDYVKVEIVDSVYAKEGVSYIFEVDTECCDECEITKAFKDKGNVLYVKKIEDEDAVHFADGSKLSDFI